MASGVDVELPQAELAQAFVGPQVVQAAGQAVGGDGVAQGGEFVVDQEGEGFGQELVAGGEVVGGGGQGQVGAVGDGAVGDGGEAAFGEQVYGGAQQGGASALAAWLGGGGQWVPPARLRTTTPPMMSRMPLILARLRVSPRKAAPMRAMAAVPAPDQTA